MMALSSMLRAAVEGSQTIWVQVPTMLLPLTIFALRAIDITIATSRMLMVSRGQRAPAWIAALLQSLIFISMISGLLANLTNPLNLIAFAAGYATGNVLGVTLEARLAPGHSLVRVISTKLGAAIADSLREESHGATEIPAAGMTGTVSLVLCFLPRRQVRTATQEIRAVDPEAYISVENVKLLAGGWQP
jgi:uncharacterized protein YebE (UPF0316 family)